MDLYAKISEALKNPEIKLLGQIPISDAEYKELLAYTRRKVATGMVQTIIPADIMLSITLVQIAIHKYSEGNYWEYFKTEINMNVSSSRTNYIGQVFISTLKRYRLFQIERDAGTKYAYVENIKAHTFVPNNYLSGYFDFLFAFYDRNLLRQIPININDDFSEMSEFFANTLKDSSDSFSLRNLDNKPAKSYKLLKATRALFAQGDANILSNVMYGHLKIIDDYYYDEKKPIDSCRFGNAFTKWIEHATEFTNDNRRRNKRRSDVFYHRPYFHINRSTGDIALVIPEQKIRNEDFNGNVIVTIIINGISKCYQPSMYRAFGVLVSEQIKIPIDDMFAEIKVTISSATDKLFEIPRRSYRIFDEEFYEMLKLHSGHNYLLVEKGRKVRGAESIYTNYEYRHWDEYSFGNVDEKTVIYIDNVPISTTGSFIIGPDFTHVSSEYKLLDCDKEIQSAYRHPNISFKVEKNALVGCFVWCNSKRFQVETVASTIIELPDDIESYGVTIILNDLLDYEDCLYKIILDEPGKARKEICRYVLISALRCRSEKPRYIFSSEALISISGDYNIRSINCTEIEDTNGYILDLTSGVEYADFLLSLDKHDYTVRVPLKIFKHGFENVWHFSRPEYLWHLDMKNDLFISMPGATDASVIFSSRQMQLETPGKSLGNGVFRFDITQIAQEIRTSQNPYNYISIKYKDNKDRKLSLYRVLNRLYVEKAAIFFDENHKASVDVSYQGKNDLVISFCDMATDTMVVKRKVINGKNEFPELTETGLYTMHMFETTADPFGFVQEQHEIGKPKYGIGVINLNDISNCKVLIRSVSYRGSWLTLNYSYGVNNLNRIDEFTYTGTLTEKHRPDKTGVKYRASILAESILLECMPDGGELVVLSIQSHYDEDIYDPIYYDKKLKKFVCSDNVSNKEYSRYVALYDDCTEFGSEIRRTSNVIQTC